MTAPGRWERLFERGAAADTSLETIRSVRDAVREREAVGSEPDAVREGEAIERTESERIEPPPERPNPARVVADADVLAADLLIGGATREALDHVRSHSWVELVASDALLAETERLVASISDDTLAADHRARLAADRVRVDHPDGDHPALASAYRGGAAHVLSFDDDLGSTAAGLALKPRVSVSVRPPDAFATLFDPASLYEAVEGGSYPGPDRDPRS